MAASAGSQRPSADADCVEIGITNLANADALMRIGSLIDNAYDSCNAEKTSGAFLLLDEMQHRSLSSAEIATVHYFRANAWANRQSERRQLHQWLWEQPEIQEQILELRRAVRHEGFQELPTIRRCQILTNLANQLNTVGRFIEAIEIWDQALAIEPNFAMALGNRGIGLRYYGDANYDAGHRANQLVAAHDSFAQATGPSALYEALDHEEFREKFIRLANVVAGVVDIDAVRKSVDFDNHSLGKSSHEREYRRWCLDERLFLNPLNDLGPISIAARDVLTLPDLRVPGVGSEIPKIIGFFNQMKQEFVSSRFLFYEGWRAAVEGIGPHFSDSNVRLYNTLDYPVYGFNAERMRVAYRSAYSLFDKIGYFINAYLEIGHSEPVRKVAERFQLLASRRTRSWTIATAAIAVLVSTSVSTSLASRRLRPSQAKVRSMTHRRPGGLRSDPWKGRGQKAAEGVAAAGGSPRRRVAA